MNALEDLLREDLRDFAGYRSARSEALDGMVWLNANESSWPNSADSSGSVRRYPEPQPKTLRTELAALYDCAPEQLLIGRGSDEAIDLLVRAFCTPNRDAVLVTPPVFGMYAVCARLQGARVLEVMARDETSGWRVDLDEVAEVALADGAKLVFLCSPGNPTGELLSLPAIDALARKLEGRALVVVDEAYADYANANAQSAITLLTDHTNLAVLRTLSKAHALAAARIGCLIADEELIGLLRRCQAPYPVPAPCAALALRALSPKALTRTKVHVREARQERERLRLALSSLPGVRHVYDGHGNFLLVRFEAAEAVFKRLLAAGIVVRDLRSWPRLDDALRITIGTPEQNDGVIAALSTLEAAA